MKNNVQLDRVKSENGLLKGYMKSCYTILPGINLENAQLWLRRFCKCFKCLQYIRGYYNKGPWCQLFCLNIKLPNQETLIQDWQSLQCMLHVDSLRIQYSIDSPCSPSTIMSFPNKVKDRYNWKEGWPIGLCPDKLEVIVEKRKRTKLKQLFSLSDSDTLLSLLMLCFYTFMSKSC